MEECREGEPDSVSHPQPLTRTNVTLHDTIWSHDLPTPRPSQGHAIPSQSSQHTDMQASGAPSDDEQSYSSQDTMILIGPDTDGPRSARGQHRLTSQAENRLRAEHQRKSPSPGRTISPENWAPQSASEYVDGNADIQDKGDISQSEPSASVHRHSGVMYVLAKAPGVKQTTSQPNSDSASKQASRLSMSINYQADYGEPSEPEESVEEVREGSPEPQCYESINLLKPVVHQAKNPSPPNVPAEDHNLLPIVPNQVREDEDRDDGYDSPGGQSSETSSTESNTAAEKSSVSKSAPHRSILPKQQKGTEGTKGPKVQKKVRFRTPEIADESDDVSEHRWNLSESVKEKKRSGHGYLFEMDVKIPSFRAMNEVLRRQRTGCPPLVDAPSSSSSLEKQLQMLALDDDDNDDDKDNEAVIKESSSIPKPSSAGNSRMLSPSSVTMDRQVLYSNNTQPAHPSPVVHDSETGERHSPLPQHPSAETPHGEEGPPLMESLAAEHQDYDSFHQFIDQRNSSVETDSGAYNVPLSVEVASTPAPRVQRRVHFADPLISDVNYMNEPQSSPHSIDGSTYSPDPAIASTRPPVGVDRYSIKEAHTKNPSQDVPGNTQGPIPQHDQLSNASSKSGSSTSSQSLVRDSYPAPAEPPPRSDVYPADYANTGGANSVRDILAQMRVAQSRPGLNRSLLHSNPAAAAIPSRMSQDDHYVKLRDNENRHNQAPRPMSDYGYHNYNMAANTDIKQEMRHEGEHYHPKVPHTTVPHTGYVPPEGPPHEQHRPKFASSADIYGILEKNRQNPFRPVPAQHPSMTKTPDVYYASQSTQVPYSSQHHQHNPSSAETYYLPRAPPGPPPQGHTWREPQAQQEWDSTIQPQSSTEAWAYSYL